MIIKHLVSAKNDQIPCMFYVILTFNNLSQMTFCLCAEEKHPAPKGRWLITCLDPTALWWLQSPSTFLQNQYTSYSTMMSEGREMYYIHLQNYLKCKSKSFIL